MLCDTLVLCVVSLASKGLLLPSETLGLAWPWCRKVHFLLTLVSVGPAWGRVLLAPFHEWLLCPAGHALLLVSTSFPSPIPDRGEQTEVGFAFAFAWVSGEILGLELVLVLRRSTNAITLVPWEPPAPTAASRLPLLAAVCVLSRALGRCTPGVTCSREKPQAGKQIHLQGERLNPL